MLLCKNSKKQKNKKKHQKLRDHRTHGSDLTRRRNETGETRVVGSLQKNTCLSWQIHLCLIQSKDFISPQYLKQ